MEIYVVNMHHFSVPTNLFIVFDELVHQRQQRTIFVSSRRFGGAARQLQWRAAPPASMAIYRCIKNDKQIWRNRPIP